MITIKDEVDNTLIYYEFNSRSKFKDISEDIFDFWKKSYR